MVTVNQAGEQTEVAIVIGRYMSTMYICMCACMRVAGTVLYKRGSVTRKVRDFTSYYNAPHALINIVYNKTCMQNVAEKKNGMPRRVQWRT